jgi:hypothetical protein
MGQVWIQILNISLKMNTLRVFTYQLPAKQELFFSRPRRQLQYPPAFRSKTRPPMIPWSASFFISSKYVPPQILVPILPADSHPLNWGFFFS